MSKPHRSRRLRGPASLWSILLFLFTSPLPAQLPIVYGFQDGSWLRDECSCQRPPIEGPLFGSFTLERLPVRAVEESYEITGFTASACAACPTPGWYLFVGGGNYHLPSHETQSGHLDLVLDGKTAVVLESGAVEVAAPWPMIDLTLTEDGTRDPSHKFTLRVIAAPQAELVPYELVKGTPEGSGSRLEVICPACEVVHPFIPLEGTLFAALVFPVDDGFSVYRLDQIRLKDLLPDLEYAITGSGSYEEGGDAEIMKRGRLTLAFTGVPDFRELRGGPVTVRPGQGFPLLDLEVEETRKVGLWYRLHLVARPVQASAFRRGDANADGALDIADAVAILGRLFLGGGLLRCVDAADANDDDSLSVSDPITILSWLYLAGDPLPPPGLQDCGGDPTPDALGCVAGC